MVDNSALNSSTQTAGTGGEIYGPGVIDLNIVISFNRLGPHRLNSFPFFLDENQVAASGFLYGHFDTTTIFSVFPDSTSVAEIEQSVGSAPVGTGSSPFGGNGSGTGN